MSTRCGPLLQRHSTLGEQRVVLFKLLVPSLDPTVGAAGSPCHVLCEVILVMGCKRCLPGPQSRWPSLGGPASSLHPALLRIGTYIFFF